mgnify:CR=1 FL=1
MWTLISLEDDACLAGTSIQKVLNSFLDILEVNYVLLEDIGSPGTYNILHDNQFPILPLSRFLDYLPQVTQFDWGNFYLFKDPISDCNEILAVDDYEKIRLSETTIRAVDYAYIYVYTPYKEVAERVKACGFKIDSIKEGELTSLDYPF